jgi:ABC-type antimicrobial peptide transport system permease subunit
VACRTREIGIRMAVGAARANVLWLVMREVLLLFVIGVAFAVPLSWMLSKYVQSEL